MSEQSEEELVPVRSQEKILLYEGVYAEGPIVEVISPAEAAKREAAAAQQPTAEEPAAEEPAAEEPAAEEPPAEEPPAEEQHY